MKSIAALFSIVLIVIVPGGHGQSTPPRNYVSVLGEAEISVMPDMAIFTLEVISLNKDLSLAKKANDASTSKTLQFAKSSLIKDDDVRTDSFTISPKYRSIKSDSTEREFIGYEVKKSIKITLRDLNKMDGVLTGAISAGVNRIVDVSFDHSKMRSFVEQVRVSAVKNAQAKATAYAQQLGQKIGKAVSIREDGADTMDFGSGSGYGSGNGDGEGDGWSDPNALITRDVTFAIGKLKVGDKIFVVFSLE